MTNQARGSIRDEREQFEFRSSTKNFMFKSGIGWLTLAIAPFTMGLSLIVLAYIALKYLTSRYVLDGDRLRITQGIIFRKEEEIELYRVKDVKATFSVIQQIFGTGNIVITSSDTTGFPTGRRRAMFIIGNVSDARNLRETIRTLVEGNRAQKNVREFDMA